jgi:hypothetical protein
MRTVDEIIGCMSRVGAVVTIETMCSSRRSSIARSAEAYCPITWQNGSMVFPSVELAHKFMSEVR